MPAILALQDGTTFQGTSVGAEGQTIGEVVFNTAMTGYQEILTDPSYCRQIVTLTYPHIGNTGTNSEDMESAQLHASGLIIRDSSRICSNWRSDRSFGDFLKQGGTVAIADIDTRKLTRIIREKGAQSGCIMTGDASAETAIAHAGKFPGISGMDLAKFVTTDRQYQWAHGTSFGRKPRILSRRIERYQVVAYDFLVNRASASRWLVWFATMMNEPSSGRFWPPMTRSRWYVRIQTRSASAATERAAYVSMVGSRGNLASRCATDTSRSDAG